MSQSPTAVARTRRLVLATALVIVALAGLTPATSPAQAVESVIRTPSGQLIREGTSKALVLRRLGEPDTQQIINYGFDGRRIEESWVYLEYRTQYTVIFNGDRVERIEVERILY